MSQTTEATANTALTDVGPDSTGWWRSIGRRLDDRLTAPVDIASLALFRIAFGGMLVIQFLGYLATVVLGRDYIAASWINPPMHFKYYGFEWVKAWPGIGMYLHIAALGVLAFMIMRGTRYRVSAALFCVGFGYLFLLEQATYLNHYYLVWLVSLLMIIVPAHRAHSSDARRNPAIRSKTAPTWALWLLRFQIAVVYFFGGVAKLNADWLAGKPLNLWLGRRADHWLWGNLLQHDWAPYFFSYGGLLFDLLVVPFIMWRRTRVYAFLFAISFHLMNATLFNIGIFPWMMLAATTLFCEPDWPRRVARRFGIFKGSFGAPTDGVALHAEATGTRRSWSRRVLATAVALYVAVQILFPLRHFLYPGNASWTEEGHRFAWHMMLRSKRSRTVFIVHNRAADSTYVVDPRDHISARWNRKMASRPDMVLQFAHFLADEARKNGADSVGVRALARAGLNGREPQLLIDPKVDLAAVTRSLESADWIMPLAHDVPTTQEEVALRPRTASALESPADRVRNPAMNR